MNLKLKNKFAFVTGGSYGIGKAIALALAEEGCNVAICARTQEPLDQTLEEIRSKGVQAIGVVGNVLQESDIKNIVYKIVKEWGTIHILVNNVGGGGKRVKEVVENVPDPFWLEVYTLNAFAAVRFTKLVLPLMKKQRWGRVITIASIQGYEGGGRPWYNMAKSAEISLMKTLAMDSNFSGNNITFNSVAPGAIITDGNEWDLFKKENPKLFEERIQQKCPLGRLGTPEEVANLVLFLSSPQAALINGTCIPADGAESRSF